jgi:hypothetical protein
MSPPVKTTDPRVLKPRSVGRQSAAFIKNTASQCKSFVHGNISASNRERILTKIQRNLHPNRAIPYSVRKDPLLFSNHLALVDSFHALVPLPVSRLLSSLSKSA